LLNIGLRYPGRLNKNFCHQHLLTGYSIKVCRENLAEYSLKKRFGVIVITKDPQTVSTYLTEQIPGTHAGRTPVIPTGRSLLINGQLRAPENSAVFRNIHWTRSSFAILEHSTVPSGHWWNLAASCPADDLRRALRTKFLKKELHLADLRAASRSCRLS
jgi:hypothetical protein